MKSHRFFWLLSAITLSAFLAAAAPGLPPIPKGFGHWKKVSVGKNMTVQVPGSLKATDVALSPEHKLMFESIKTFHLENPHSEDYQCVVNFITYNKSVTANLEGAADGVANNLKKDSTISNLKTDQKAIQIGKLKGIRLDGTFGSEGKTGEVHSVIAVSGNLLWSVIIVDMTPSKYTQVSETILDSMQIKAP